MGKTVAVKRHLAVSCAGPFLGAWPPQNEPTHRRPSDSEVRRLQCGQIVTVRGSIGRGGHRRHHRPGGPHACERFDSKKKRCVDFGIERFTFALLGPLHHDCLEQSTSCLPVRSQKKMVGDTGNVLAGFELLVVVLGSSALTFNAGGSLQP